MMSLNWIKVDSMSENKGFQGFRKKKLSLEKEKIR